MRHKSGFLILSQAGPVLELFYDKRIALECSKLLPRSLLPTIFTADKREFKEDNKQLGTYSFGSQEVQKSIKFNKQVVMQSYKRYPGTPLHQFLDACPRKFFSSIFCAR